MPPKRPIRRWEAYVAAYNEAYDKAHREFYPYLSREFFLAGKGQRNQKGAEIDGGPTNPR